MQDEGRGGVPYHTIPYHTIPCAGVGGARVCRMRDGEECRRLELGWVLDSGDNMALAVNTETGWRKIMVRTVLQLH